MLQSFKLKTTFLLLISFFCSPLRAANLDEYNAFINSYAVREDQPFAVQFQNVVEVLAKPFIKATAEINLLKFVEIKKAWGPTAEPYQRTKHFGGWIRGQGAKHCQNTRAVVLIRDSAPDKLVLSADECRVERGSWEDPFTGLTFSYAKDLQIDHFVPLKNAFISNASQWSFEKRCLYANYLNVSHHLQPVYGRENSKKGDRGPEGYMPPNDAFSCQYLYEWLHIKLVWGLRLNPDEAQAIQDLSSQYQCNLKDFRVPLSEVQKARQEIAQLQFLCQKPKTN